MTNDKKLAEMDARIQLLERFILCGMDRWDEACYEKSELDLNAHIIDVAYNGLRISAHFPSLEKTDG